MNKIKTILGLSLFAIVGKLLALLRQSLLIATLGLGQQSDIYLTSFRLPDLLYNLLIYGTLLPAFIPIYTELRGKDKQEANHLSSSVLAAGLLAVGTLSLFTLIFSRSLLHLAVPGFSGEVFEQTLTLTRVLLLSPLIFTLSTVLTGILHSAKRFAVAQAAPLCYNLGIIFGLYAFYPKFGLIGLAYGVLIGAALHALVQIPFVVKEGLWFKLPFDFSSSSFKRIGTLFLPRLLGVDPGQISLLIASFFGSLGLSAGSISVFTLATDLMQAPVAVFAYSASIVALPLLSENFAQKRFADFTEGLRTSIKNIMFFLVPASLYMVLYRAQIVRILFGRQNFSWENTTDLLQSVGIMSFGIIAFGLIPLFSRAFYAKQNTKLPVIFSLISVATNFIISWPLSIYFGSNGLAAAFTISIWLNALLLIIYMRRSLLRLQSHEEIFNNALTRYIVTTFAISFISALFAHALLQLGPIFFDTHTGVGLVFQLALSFIPSALLYVYGSKIWLNLDILSRK
ncbi:MAG TPA: murein biosynthesis integral membrane protein MurJ [Patescibacteria group bacterium]|nr:murein biosynthesis integral membrane protein MurJ [Patescibacteria group bacterium]